MRCIFLILAGWLSFCTAVVAQQNTPVRVAVAANFKLTVDRLAVEFSKKNGELTPLVSSGATGLLYSQIRQGAPFDVFFAADQVRPARLEAEGRIVPGSRHTYAIGKLVLWRPGRPWSGTLEQALRASDVRVVAIANPAVAPYGAAAQQVLEALRLWRDPPFRIVQGESLGQAFQFVASGNAQVGFISLSQVMESPQARRAILAEEIEEIDQRLYAPLAQDAVLLQRSANNPAASRFMEFVRGPEGRAIISQAGYAASP